MYPLQCGHRPPINMISLSLVLILGVSAQNVDYSQFVNPFIGSEGAIKGYACMLNNTDDIIAQLSRELWC